MFSDEEITSFFDSIYVLTVENPDYNMFIDAKKYFFENEKALEFSFNFITDRIIIPDKYLIHKDKMKRCILAYIYRELNSNTETDFSNFTCFNEFFLSLFDDENNHDFEVLPSILFNLNKKNFPMFLGELLNKYRKNDNIHYFSILVSILKSFNTLEVWPYCYESSCLILSLLRDTLSNGDNLFIHEDVTNNIADLYKKLNSFSNTLFSETFLTNTFPVEFGIYIINFIAISFVSLDKSLVSLIDNIITLIHSILVIVLNGDQEMICFYSMIINDVNLFIRIQSTLLVKYGNTYFPLHHSLSMLSFIYTKLMTISEYNHSEIVPMILGNCVMMSNISNHEELLLDEEQYAFFLFHSPVSIDTESHSIHTVSSLIYFLLTISLNCVTLFLLDFAEINEGFCYMFICYIEHVGKVIQIKDNNELQMKIIEKANCIASSKLAVLVIFHLISVLPLVGVFQDSLISFVDENNLALHKFESRCVLMLLAKQYRNEIETTGNPAILTEQVFNYFFDRREYDLNNEIEKLLFVIMKNNNSVIGQNALQLMMFYIKSLLQFDDDSDDLNRAFIFVENLDILFKSLGADFERFEEFYHYLSILKEKALDSVNFIYVENVLSLAISLNKSKKSLIYFMTFVLDLYNEDYIYICDDILLNHLFDLILADVSVLSMKITDTHTLNTLLFEISTTIIYKFDNMKFLSKVVKLLLILIIHSDLSSELVKSVNDFTEFFYDTLPNDFPREFPPYVNTIMKQTLFTELYLIGIHKDITEVDINKISIVKPIVSSGNLNFAVSENIYVKEVFISALNKIGGCESQVEILRYKIFD